MRGQGSNERSGVKCDCSGLLTLYVQNNFEHLYCILQASLVSYSPS